MFDLEDDFGLSHKFLCIGLEHHGKVLTPRHVAEDDGLHYSAGLCPDCLYRHRQLRKADIELYQIFMQDDHRVVI